MYWLRTTTLIPPSVLLNLYAFLDDRRVALVVHSGRFLKRECLMAGIASGMLLYILLGNAFVHWFPAYLAFAFAAILIFVIGLWISRTRKIHWSELINLEFGLQVLALFFIFGIFELILRGLGLGDDLLASH